MKFTVILQATAAAFTRVCHISLICQVLWREDNGFFVSYGSGRRRVYCKCWLDTVPGLRDNRVFVLLRCCLPIQNSDDMCTLTIIATLILCSHYATVGQTVWQRLSALRVCCSVARSSDVHSHVSNVFDPCDRTWDSKDRQLSNCRIVWILRATVWRTNCRT